LQPVSVRGALDSLPLPSACRLDREVSKKGKRRKEEKKKNKESGEKTPHSKRSMQGMNPPVIWFNRHLSNIWQSWKLLREVRKPDEFLLVGSHTHKNYVGKRQCDFYEREPTDLSDQAYVDYCLDMVRKYKVRVFFPWRRLFAILRAEAEFQASGVQVGSVAGIPTLEVLEDKAQQYAALGSGIVPVPETVVVKDGAGFIEAYRKLKQRHKVICYKPTRSIYALGFKIVIESQAVRKRIPALNEYVISYEEACRTLTAQSPFADLLVMPYLPGAERSVDCLADHGRLLRCIIRRKTPGATTKQLIEKHEGIEELAGRITRKLKLNAIFNIQFRDAGETPYLLEINPRMSGGAPYAAKSGLVLPYWAIRLALGTAREVDIPYPQTGIWIRTQEVQRSY
jgi:hypothetical protein